MKTPQIPDTEEIRLACLAELDILDTPSEPVYDRVTEVVSDVLETPIALVSLVDAQRQWFKSKVGLSASETGRDISFCGHVVFSNQELIVTDTLEDERFADNPLVTGEPKIRFYAGMPLTVTDGVTLGSLCVIDTKPRQLSTEELSFFRKMSEVIVEVFKHERMALRDHLTGAFNRRMFDSLGNKLVADYNRNKAIFSLITLDIDHFKTINDYHGHAAGDQALVGIADVLTKAMRAEDYLFRIGGEEFVILAPGANLEQAVDYAERLRFNLGSQAFHARKNEFQVTGSFGVATYDIGDENLHSLLKRADTAMYEAKAAGRNCVMVSRLAGDNGVQDAPVSAIS